MHEHPQTHTEIYVCVYICVCVFAYIYIYTYISVLGYMQMPTPILEIPVLISKSFRPPPKSGSGAAAGSRPEAGARVNCKAARPPLVRAPSRRSVVHGLLWCSV